MKTNELMEYSFDDLEPIKSYKGQNEEAINAFKSMGVNVNLRYVPFEDKVINILSAYQYLINEFPEIKVEIIADLYSKQIEDNIRYIDSLKVNGPIQIDNAKTEEQKQTVINNINTLTLSNINTIKSTNFNTFKDADAVGEYDYYKAKIYLNITSSETYDTNVFYHEFGHAVESQYFMDEDEEMNAYFNSLSKNEISKNVSDYANKNVSEFMAECFEKYYYFNERNSIVSKTIVMMKNKINKGKAMTHDERVMKEFWEKSGLSIEK